MSASSQSTADMAFTRQQLNALDQLIQKMLELPVNQVAGSSFLDPGDQLPNVAQGATEKAPYTESPQEQEPGKPGQAHPQHSPPPVLENLSSLQRTEEKVPKSLEEPPGERGMVPGESPRISFEEPGTFIPSPIPAALEPPGAGRQEVQEAQDNEGTVAGSGSPVEPEKLQPVFPGSPERTIEEGVNQPPAEDREHGRGLFLGLVLFPLTLCNLAFDLATVPLGPLGHWLRGHHGRAWLGWMGIGLLATAAIAWFMGWNGWTW